MKCTYIYLNKYTNGLLYIGSHTWKTPSKGIDLSYKGSSKYAEKLKCVLESTEVLEFVSEQRKYKAETYWIEHYATLYGIHPTVKYTAHLHNNFWVDKFKDGIVINGHSNTLEQAHSASLSPESLIKKSESLKRHFSNSRKCILNDGFIGTYSELKKHTGLSQGMLGMSMTKAYRRGSYTNKYGWTFQPYIVQNTVFNTDRVIESSKQLMLDVNGYKGTVEEVSSHFNVNSNTVRYWIRSIYLKGDLVLSKGKRKGWKIKIIKHPNK